MTIVQLTGTFVKVIYGDLTYSIWLHDIGMQCKYL